ncbi:hypothetical protein [Methylorubrum thiocyanatum]|uniref:hypothetical protein n=1 Tax=Methylorubrum thiocyanatum TaxID=47958 RepID=UPI00398C4E03
MRALLALLLATAPAVAADRQPSPGRYCPIGIDLPDISIGPEPGTAGVDLMDCSRVTFSAGRLRSPSCYGMGGALVPYDVDLVVEADGTLLHDGARYRRCP